jgi:hypothetical protein
LKQYDVTIVVFVDDNGILSLSLCDGNEDVADVVTTNAL